MRPPFDPGPHLGPVINRYVTCHTGSGRRYLSLLDGCFAGMESADRTDFLSSMAEDCVNIADHDLELMLDFEWRTRLTAAWLIGFGRRDDFRDMLGDRLLDSEYMYAGQGYCAALAGFGTEQDAKLLSTYLNRYLRPPHRDFDQAWALGALMHLDDALGTRYSAPFLRPGGLWETWSNGRFSADYQRTKIAVLCGMMARTRQPHASS